MYQRIKTILSKTIETLLVINLLLMVFFVFFGIIMRYLLKMPLVWGEEIALLGQVWLTFMSVGVLCQRIDHMVVDYVASLLSPRKKLILDMINQVLIILFFIVFIYSGHLVVDMTSKSITPGLNISVSFMYLPTVIGGLLALFYNVDLLISTGKELKAISKTETT